MAELRRTSTFRNTWKKIAWNFDSWGWYGYNVEGKRLTLKMNSNTHKFALELTSEETRILRNFLNQMQLGSSDVITVAEANKTYDDLFKK